MPSWKKVITSGSDASLNTVSTNYIDFNTGSAVPAWKSGRIFWDNTEGCLSVYNAEADITLQVGQENWTRVFNDTGVTIANGAAVRIIGTHGDHPEVVLAQSTQVSGSSNIVNQILGIATHEIEASTFGYITTQGLVRGLNTNAFTDGDTLYVSSSAGLLTNIPPNAPYKIIPVAQVVKAGPGGSGILYVAVQQPMDFGDLSSAQTNGIYSYGDLWSYQPNGGTAGVWRHTNQLSGSYAVTGSWSATSFTGSLLGTASYATQALSASYAPGGGTPFPFNGNAQISGSFGVTGSFVAITVNDVAFTRKLHDSQTGSGSLDFGNRNLLDGTGNGVFNWNGIAATIDASLYLNQTIGATTRDSLITNIGYGGFSLNDVTFDSGVQDFDLVFLDTDGIWYQVIQTTNTSTKMLGICQSVNPMTNIGIVITEGDIVITTGAGYPQVAGANYGLPVYIKESGGTLMSTTIPTTGYVRLLGHCYHNPGGGTEWIMKFRPSHEWYII